MRQLLLSLALLMVAIPACTKTVKPARYTVSWSTPIPVVSGGYARVHRLNDGRLMLVYSASGNAYAMFSSDNAVTWSEPVMAMESFTASNEKGSVLVRCSNAEFAQLSDSNPYHPGRIIYASNLRPVDYRTSIHPLSIVCSVSDDGGKTWSEKRTVYASRTWDVDASKGAWEPFVLELPDGRVQVYFTDNTPYYAVGDNRSNNISVVESSDGGDSWGPERIVCHTQGGWDGMPVVTIQDGYMYLVVEHKNERGSKYAMEIQGMSCTLDENWPEEIKLGDARRFYPFKPKDGIYCGAPYIIHTDNYFVVSCQSSEGADEPLKDDHCIPAVFVIPIPSSASPIFGPMTEAPIAVDIDQTKYSGLWNSLCDLGDDCILLVTQYRGTIVTVKGKIQKK
ncbi:MAG: exo-alpha-sialidase [Bacteroidales bacterium]|jgi:hypothetical protein|nr:exo-alpha-sialidase [Bacteroidales bacterium]